jgi:hypothetical protein
MRSPRKVVVDETKIVSLKPILITDKAINMHHIATSFPKSYWASAVSIRLAHKQLNVSINPWEQALSVVEVEGVGIPSFSNGIAFASYAYPFSSTRIDARDEPDADTKKHKDRYTDKITNKPVRHCYLLVLRDTGHRSKNAVSANITQPSSEDHHLSDCAPYGLTTQH